MLLSAASVLVVAQSSSEIPEGLMNNPVLQIFGDHNGICQWKSAQINLMMLAWGKYNMLQDFISPVIGN